MNGVLVIDKPRGVTSFDVVAWTRRAARERRVGHAGTLDPEATGVLCLCLGEATKLVPYLMDADKEYAATVRLGVTTDCDDADPRGRVVARADAAALAALRAEDIQAALAGFVGTIAQRPPAFSALKVDGQRLHQRARAARAQADRDEAPEHEPGDDLSAALQDKIRPVTIYELRLLALRLPSTPSDDAWPELDLWVRCGKGTYIRSLARDLGERLGVGGHLTALRRLRVGRFALDQATGLTRDGFTGPPRLAQPAEALAHLPALQLPRDQADRVRQGHLATLAALREAALALAPDETSPRYLRALDQDGALCAVLVLDADALRIGRGFVRPPAGDGPGTTQLTPAPDDRKTTPE